MNSPHPTEELIEELVQQLDAEAGASYDARAELIAIGPDAIPTLIAGLPSLGDFGQLTAIETFTAIGDPRCGPTLIALLDGDNPTVREWAAEALASLGIDDAVEPLRRAYRACLEGGTPPDWCEPVSLRWALTELGARTPVVPPLTARLATTVGPDIPGWPSARFAEIVDDLADHGQVILFSQFWRVDGEHTYWTRGPAWTGNSTGRPPGPPSSRKPEPGPPWKPPSPRQPRTPTSPSPGSPPPTWTVPARPVSSGTGPRE
ncbi:HEAT repeat domain-containing protein [Streptomyces xanthophaeus]|uniref:HEAT repeat domain-containing protein n=1 Tax=Streptomyces xanthophaeus TaxID=67385 RepID=UPI00386F1BFC|nr:HEAT repeat domain-containing protein [Streptomyces xanthophaeus]WST60580.1 HEAT repeat domain-containing protein [Streptomyces xanthophaeus]